MNSRARELERKLSNLNWDKALKAFDLVRKEMTAQKGFKRFNGSDYFYHPIEVALLLLNLGVRDEEVIIGALLHDIIEDVKGYTQVTLALEYGENVAGMVNLVTKERGIDYKNPVNLQVYLDKIFLSPEASLIKAADRVHNFLTLGDATPKHKLKQVKETQEYFIPFFKRCRNEYPRYAHVFYTAKAIIEPLMWEITDHYTDLMRVIQAKDSNELTQLINSMGLDVLQHKEECLDN